MAGKNYQADPKNMPKSHGGPPGGPGRHGYQKPKDAKKTLKRLGYYIGKSKGKLTLVFILMAVSSVAMLAASYFLKPLINNYILPGDFVGLAWALALLAVIVVVGALASYLQNKLMIGIAQRTSNTIRKDLFAKMQALPLKYFDNHTHGELMSRYTNDMDNIYMALEQSLVQLFSSAVLFVGTIVLMIVLSPLLFLITAIILTVMMLISKTLGGRSRTHFQQQQKNLGILNGFIEESIEGIKEVKVFNHEQQMRDEFYELNSNYRDASIKASIYAGVIMPIMNNLNNISYAATAVFGGVLTVMGSFDIGSLAAFLQFSRQAGQPINQITAQLNNVFAALAGAERIFEVMDEDPETDIGQVRLIKLEDQQQEHSWAWSDGQVQTPLLGDVRFKDVNFSYDGEVVVLKDISLFAKPGQKIAFVGSTGAGKTTITNLLNRFYEIQDGQITYDGIDIKQIKKDDLRHSLGMVLQDTHLFTDTVMENIRYGRLNAADEDCIAAAKASGADGFIRRLPQGYQTILRGDGANLSQGQRQLLAIARVYVSDPPVMILDEATSSIDTRTEHLIEQGMDGLMEGRTVFVIAHRLSTIRNAKAIIVLEHGQIIERGNHQELLEQQGRYYQLYTGQHEFE